MSLIFRINSISTIRNQLQTQWSKCRQICTTANRQSLNDRLRRIGSNSQKELFLKQTDKIPEDFELIYRATSVRYLAAAKYCVISSTAAVVGLALWQLLSQGNILPTPVPEMIYGGLIVKDEDLIYFACGFVAINVIFSGILRRYPLRIYKKIDKYIAVYESTIPFRGVQQHTFSRGQVYETKPLLEAWKDCYYRLGNRNSLLFIYYFKTPAEFNQMF